MGHYIINVWSRKSIDFVLYSQTTMLILGDFQCSINDSDSSSSYSVSWRGKKENEDRILRGMLTFPAWPRRQGRKTLG